MINKDQFEKLMKAMEHESVWMSRARIIAMLKYYAGIKPEAHMGDITREEMANESF